MPWRNPTAGAAHGPRGGGEEAAQAPRRGGLLQALKLAMGCCVPVPAATSTVEEVLRQLEESRPSKTLQPRSVLYISTESRSGAAQHRRLASFISSELEINYAPFGCQHWSSELRIGIGYHEYCCLDVSGIESWY